MTDSLSEAVSHKHATAFLTSTLVHMGIVLTLALLFVATNRREKVIELEVFHRTDATDEPITEFVSVEPAQDEPAHASSMASLQLAEEEFEFSEMAELPSLSLADGDDGIGLLDSFDTIGVTDKIEGYSSDFSRQIRRAQEHGIDIVIVFDSTGSMQVAINGVKQRITDIGGALLRKIPKARLSLVTYRDTTDAYLVRGTPLTSNLRELTNFLFPVRADGGGDTPEAVEAGMGWALTKNEFRDKSQKAMIIFGDAPPHQSKLPLCLNLAREFRAKHYGRVSTVCCGGGGRLVEVNLGRSGRSRRPRKTWRVVGGIPEFHAIAKAGAGDVYMMENARKLMEDLLVLAFGKRHRKDVLKFFELD